MIVRIKKEFCFRECLPLPVASGYFLDEIESKGVSSCDVIQGHLHIPSSQHWIVFFFIKKFAHSCNLCFHEQFFLTGTTFHCLFCIFQSIRGITYLWQCTFWEIPFFIDEIFKIWFALVGGILNKSNILKSFCDPLFASLSDNCESHVHHFKSKFLEFIFSIENESTQQALNLLSWIFPSLLFHIEFQPSLHQKSKQQK